MSTDDHTPDTREVRSMYCAGSNLHRETPEQHYLGAPAPDYGAEFDRFLARVRRDTLTALADHWDETVSEHAERPLFSASGTYVRHYRDTLYPSRESGDQK